MKNKYMGGLPRIHANKIKTNASYDASNTDVEWNIRFTNREHLWESFGGHASSYQVVRLPLRAHNISCKNAESRTRRATEHFARKPGRQSGSPFKSIVGTLTLPLPLSEPFHSLFLSAFTIKGLRCARNTCYADRWSPSRADRPEPYRN